MSDYTQVTDFSAKDALTTGDAEKAISGADVDGEFSAISTAIATKIDKPGSPSTDDLLVWSGSAWAAKDIGVDGSAGQSYVSDGTNASWTTGVSLSSATDLTNGGADDTASWTITGIPSWVNIVHVLLDSGQLSGTDDIYLRLGPSGGPESSGYQFGWASGSDPLTSSTTEFRIGRLGGSSRVIDIVTTLRHMGSNKWLAEWNGGQGTTDNTTHGAGVKTLAGALDRIQVKSSGTDNFAGGTVVLQWY